MLTKDLNKIIGEITEDNVVSIPTDTVYGLSCNISKAAVAKVINLKKKGFKQRFYYNLT